MKRIFQTIFLALLASLSFTACTEDDNSENNPSKVAVGAKTGPLEPRVQNQEKVGDRGDHRQLCRESVDHRVRTLAGDLLL